jgi:DNA gyrase/topoisomerase IV subunit A
LYAEQRTNDVKIFLLSSNNLENTIKIFRSSRNRKEIEQRLVETYKNSEIRMDSLQAKVLSDMRFHELCIDTYEGCLKRREELIKEIKDIEDILNTEKGIDKLIMAELRDGIKKFGVPRKSNVVPHKISIDTEVIGECILQLSSDGIILRKQASNVYEEPIPIDSNGFAVKVENDSAFIAIDDKGYHSFIKVKEIPVDQEVPLNRYIDKKLGTIIALLPFEMADDLYCTLISKNGVLKKIRVSDMKVSKKPCIDIKDDDILVRGILTYISSNKDILVYTKNGMGQRLDPNNIRSTSINAKGSEGFKLFDDEIIGCYAITSNNQYLLYITMKGKVRLNLAEFLPTRDSKHENMVNLISLSDRDKLIKILGVNKFDKVQVYFSDGDSEIIEVSKLEESTMNSSPVKITTKNAISNNIVKVKII